MLGQGREGGRGQRWERPASTDPPRAGKLPVPGTAPFEVAAGWQALWWDDFDGSSLDTSKWGYDLGNGGDVGLWAWCAWRPTRSPTRAERCEERAERLAPPNVCAGVTTSCSRTSAKMSRSPVAC